MDENGTFVLASYACDCTYLLPNFIEDIISTTWYLMYFSSFHIHFVLDIQSLLCMLYICDVLVVSPTDWVTKFVKVACLEPSLHVAWVRILAKPSCPVEVVFSH